ncbi:DUF58 domain-containing protein [Thiomicrospira sp.]|uniref:DUF58 domain-containing protein n=1 Tax=Thiomicrospira sp. TaxID=935 RepID=UPI002F9459AA
MTFLQTLKARFSKPNRAPNISRQPILSAQQIADWGQELEAYWASLPSSQRLSELALFGDQSSRFRGQGMEYEESRLYQPGDELRHLNWRLMARTGKAFTKLFQEERQAQWVIILDQRQSMRFATQGHLKVTQGARIAGWLAWMAQQQRVQLQAIGLSETVSMTPVIQGMNLYQQVMQALAIPCPPKVDRTEPKLADVLNQLKAHWPNGTRVWIISDFADLTESDQAWLTAMNESWHLSAFWIEDPAEIQLPAKQTLKLQSNHQVWLLDNQQQSQYQAWAKPQRDKHQAWLKQAGVDVHSVQTTDSLQRILASEL